MQGDILILEGRDQDGATAHRGALATWRQLRSRDIPAPEQAEAGVYEARSHFALGQPGDALNSIDAAIDVAPERIETYADAVALLATRGHLPEALELYHRLLGQSEASEYLKTYCSFWVIGLARRAGQAPDEQAVAHLKGLDGDAWYHHLATFFLGEVSYDALLKKAEGKADRAELYYYQAEALLAAGQEEAARALWRKVLETNMMGFYEYDMAGHNLRFGPARVRTEPIQRHAQAPEQPPRTSDRRSSR
jgi:tetratricopeptide (TPR) repeat protein